MIVPTQPRSHPPLALSATDLELYLSPLMCLREISLAFTTDYWLQDRLPCFFTITSGMMSKITIATKPGLHAVELYSLFGRRCDWTDIDENLFRLAESQGGNNTRRVELVIDRFQVSEYAFSKFSQTGTIIFILPPVSRFTLYLFPRRRYILRPCEESRPVHSPVGTRDTSV